MFKLFHLSFILLLVTVLIMDKFFLKLPSDIDYLARILLTYIFCLVIVLVGQCTPSLSDMKSCIDAGPFEGREAVIQYDRCPARG